MRHLTLKYRLFLAFILLILLPFTILDLYNFQKLKLNLQKKTSEQSLAQMSKMNESLEGLLGTAFKTITIFEQDSTVTSVLQNPGAGDPLDNQRKVEERFRSVTNSLFITSPPVFYMIADLNGNVYTSFQPAQTLDYGSITRSSWFRDAMISSVPYTWRIEDNPVLPDVSRSPNLIGIAAPLRDANGSIFAVAHTAVDYHVWFKSFTYGSPLPENVYLISKQGDVLVQSGTSRQDQPAARLEPALVHAMISPGTDSGFFIEDKIFGNYTVVPSFQAYLLKTVPTEVLFAELRSIQHSYMGSLAFFTLAFIIITFFITSAVTRPLLLIQAKMSDVVRKDLKVRLPENKYRGEILAIVQAFNRMIADMDALVHKLKVEERQKEASRFQMLLSQMNPHFLLNTLNTIRWLAMERHDPAIPQICMSLGRLTEAGLKLDVDLIHLEQELELVAGYVYIQQFRYDQQFKLTYDYEEKLRYALVPKLSLQPLVENSIYHGISQIPEQGLIAIRMYQQNRKLVIEVEDNGIGLAKSAEYQTEQHHNIAVKNLKERLSLLFRQEASLTYPQVEQGCLVRIELPLLLSAPYEKGGPNHVDHTAGGR